MTSQRIDVEYVSQIPTSWSGWIMLNPPCVIELMAHPHMSMFFFFNTILIVYINVDINVYIVVFYIFQSALFHISCCLMLNNHICCSNIHHLWVISPMTFIPIGCVPAAAVISAKLRRSWWRSEGIWPGSKIGWLTVLPGKKNAFWISWNIYLSSIWVLYMNSIWSICWEKPLTSSFWMIADHYWPIFELGKR